MSNIVTVEFQSYPTAIELANALLNAVASGQVSPTARAHRMPAGKLTFVAEGLLEAILEDAYEVAEVADALGCE